VVVGTVIDPSLTNELRVTVVATGLNRVAAPRAAASVVEQVVQRGAMAAPAPVLRTVRTVASPSRMAAPNYDDFEVPAITRASGVQRRAVGDGLQVESQKDDMLDIPAFLRRQAD
jgi:cell division protein FtsZ